MHSIETRRGMERLKGKSERKVSFSLLKCACFIFRLMVREVLTTLLGQEVDEFNSLGKYLKNI